ncbi:hypothetical protein [Halovivax gelatinilyticus]|uniref:hypothetical protein n=1 Tax=Halovivax gelatinilyticus TaxID=2961597 RepID=UPI0020CA4272|nr:hypothetical protein [Halovivax gelatinilyticus]
MNGVRFLIVGLFVACTIGLVSMGVAAVVEPSVTETDAEPDSTMGEEMGSFMQVSAADANGSVERGMFESSFDSSSDKEGAIADRTAALEARYAHLEARSAALANDTTIDDRARSAQFTRLAVELDSFNASVAATADRAETVGVDTDRLETLRTNASTLTGPEVAEIARSLSGVNPPGLDGESPPGKGNGDAGNSPDDRGPPGNSTDQSTDDHPPSTAIQPVGH